MKIDERNFYVAELINKHLLGTLSANEEVKLNEWLDKASNKTLYHQIKDELIKGKYHAKYKQIDIETAWTRQEARLHQQFKRLRLQRVINLAAIALLFISIGSVVYFLKQSKPGTIHIEQLAEVQTGKSKASLLLESGELIELNQLGKQTIQQKGIVIKNDSGVINYELSDKHSSSDNYNTLFVPRGGEYQISLPDGTHVWINSESKLQYPLNFTGKTRTIHLTGEAYFAVSHNPDQPFIVKTKSHEIEVLGTEFNVSAYEKDVLQHTTLIEGKVSATSLDLKGNQCQRILLPNQQIQYNSVNRQAKVTNVDAYVFKAWKDGRFVFRNQPLQDILSAMSRWYNIEIEFSNEQVACKTFSIDMQRNDSFEKVKKVLELTGAVKVETKGNRVIIKDISE